MAQRTSVWRNSFKTFRQFGETIIMFVIVNIRLFDSIGVLASTKDKTRLVRLYFISYATVTAKFRITKMTTRSLARRHIRQGLSFALYDGSHAINTTAVDGSSRDARESWHPRRPIEAQLILTNPLIG